MYTCFRVFTSIDLSFALDLISRSMRGRLEPNLSLYPARVVLSGYRSSGSSLLALLQLTQQSNNNLTTHNNHQRSQVLLNYTGIRFWHSRNARPTIRASSESTQRIIFYQNHAQINYHFYNFPYVMHMYKIHSLLLYIHSSKGEVLVCASTSLS